MKTITVQVREDHLETLARTKPIAALAELIWNALDADATEIHVEFETNEMDGLEAIRIRDNGHGLHYDDAFIVFKNLGGSWKRPGAQSVQGRRVLHGKFGKGRFRAFSLGNHVTWETQYRDGEDRFRYRILGEASRLGAFDVSDQTRGSGETGMTVEIRNVPAAAEQLRGVKALQDFTDVFAPYLRQYPGLKLNYGGIPVDPANAEAASRIHDLGEIVMPEGERARAELHVVEWTQPGKRGVYLCNAEGFTLWPALPRLHFRGFSYSAYLRSEHAARLDREGLLPTGELCPDVKILLDAARAKLREHFALREAERAQDVLAHWREAGIYPYASAGGGASETERRIFDIYATHLHQIFPDFTASSRGNQRLLLRLVQELVHSEPTRMARILDELIDFPEDKEEAILELMQT